MRTYSLALLLILFPPLAAPFSAQRQASMINTATPQGRLLQQVKDESDDAKKIALMEQFLAQYPEDEGATWVNSQMVTSCVKVGQFDKALAAAEKVLAKDPGDVGTAYEAVKAAEAKKDPDAVCRWAVQASDLARKILQAPKGSDESDEAFKERVDSAKRLDTYTEYALFNMAIQAPEPARKVELLRTLAARAPESTYLSQAQGLYFQALTQAGDVPGAVALAEKLIAKGQANEEMLATSGDYILRQKGDPQKVLDYSSKLRALVDSRSKPDSVSDADWQKWRNRFLGWGMWLEGVAYGVQGKYADSNKALRQALPQLEGNDEYKAGALFNLGVANSQLKNVADAGRFFEQCATLSTPYRAMCTDNLKRIRATYRVVK